MAKARMGGKVTYIRKDGSQKKAVHRLIRPEPSPHEAVIVKTEDKARYNKTEKVSIIDDQGNVVYQKRGGKTQVRFRLDVIPPGSVLTHNHPSGTTNVTTFSGQDVQTFANVDNISEMRATDRYGAYILRKRNPGPDSKKFADDFAMNTWRSEQQHASKRRDLQHLVNQGQLSATDANKQLRASFKEMIQEKKQWLTRNAAKYGYEYDYRPHGGKVK